ncbi:MAG: histone deacetylase family protein [Deltaproteobacteria bacterium]|nr:histone deacetylase family protein [Deltaproteobacteria bacterium]
MKVFFHQDFYRVYTSDPAAAAGRMESVVSALEGEADFLEPAPASREEILAAHTPAHVRQVETMGLYGIAALAAGGAVAAARAGMEAPAFAAIRPPGHHASADSAWGFCFFNNMAVALLSLKNQGLIQTAHVLDFDLHFGDGNVNILKPLGWVSIHNPDAADRAGYLDQVEQELSVAEADVFAVSAGFDNHMDDWGGTLATEDYQEMGRMAAAAAKKRGAGCFGVLEGGYNHAMLGQNALAFVKGMQEGWEG